MKRKKKEEKEDWEHTFICFANQGCSEKGKGRLRRQKGEGQKPTGGCEDCRHSTNWPEHFRHWCELKNRVADPPSCVFPHQNVTVWTSNCKNNHNLKITLNFVCLSIGNIPFYLLPMILLIVNLKGPLLLSMVFFWQWKNSLLMMCHTFFMVKKVSKKGKWFYVYWWHWRKTSLPPCQSFFGFLFGSEVLAFCFCWVRGGCCWVGGDVVLSRGVGEEESNFSEVGSFP